MQLMAAKVLHVKRLQLTAAATAIPRRPRLPRDPPRWFPAGPTEARPGLSLSATFPNFELVGSHRAHEPLRRRPVVGQWALDPRTGVRFPPPGPRPHRLAVARTPAFQAGEPGSRPGGATESKKGTRCLGPISCYEPLRKDAGDARSRDQPLG